MRREGRSCFRLNRLAWKAAVLVSVLLAACNGSESVRIEGRCTTVRSSQLIDAEGLRGSDGLYFSQPSIGLLGGAVALEWVAPISVGESSDSAEYVAWFDESGASLVGPTRLGYVRPPFRSALTRVGPDLVAHLWTDPDNIPAGEPEDNVALWRFRPDAAEGVAGRLPVRLPISRVRACPDCPLTSISLATAFLNVGAQGLLPVIDLGRAVAVVPAIPEECSSAAANDLRLMVFDDRGGAESIYWDDDICRNQDEAHAVNAVRLDDGLIGLLFRIGVSDGDVRYLRVDDGYQVVDGPWRVGHTFPHGSVQAGYQPKVVAVGGGRLLFTERAEGDYNACAILRLMPQEGPVNDGVRDAPWQLPCIESPEQYLTSWHELVPLPGGRAAIVWSQRSAFGGGPEAFATPLTTGVPWEEGIYMTMLTSDGLRASEVVRVTDEEATALAPTPRTAESGPFPASFSLSAASEGQDVVVTWNDNRVGAEGAYATRIRCAAL